MRILLAARHFSALGGAESAFRSRARLLTEAGHEVYVLSTDGCASTAPKWATSGKITFIRSPGLEADHLVFDTISEICPDVVDVHLTAHLEKVCAWIRICKTIPVVFTLHTNCLVCPGYFRLLRRSDKVCVKKFGFHCLVSAYKEGCNVQDPRALLNRWTDTWKSQFILRRAARVIVHDPDLITSLLPDWFDRGKISVVRPCVKVSFNNELPGEHNANVLFVGRLESGKGIDLLLKASARIGEPHSIIVVGDGPARMDMERFAQYTGVMDRVRFVGWVAHDNLDSYYWSAAVFAFPSRSETFGLVGLEALGHGVPVVAFNVGGISAWLQDGRTGYLVSPFDVSLFAARIAELLGNRDLRVQMGETGKQVVAERYSPERCYEALVDAYGKAIEAFL